MKSYFDFMNEITDDELYDGLLGYGMFADKLPPVFSSVSFLQYCKKNPGFKQNEQNYVTFNSMRNINIPRVLGIPTPMQYARLCQVLRDNWHYIKDHFKKYTAGQPYRISRIHIRKIYDNNIQAYKPVLFEMNYRNWRNDGNPETDLLISPDYSVSKYVVHADISTCFPSIYTHSIPWALVGKGSAKADRDGRRWFNKIDKYCQNVKNGETHGLLIGPHSSNLLSEIILVVVDKKLFDKGYHFIRRIDDYDCYVETYEAAQHFLNDLEFELRQFDLPLNYKKTKIDELPLAMTEDWVHRLKAVYLSIANGETRYPEISRYIDEAVRLALETGNSAVLKYAIKTLSGNENITENGKKLAIKRILHLAVLYPYLNQLLEEYVFSIYPVQKQEVKTFANSLYKDSFRINNYEGICYAIYFSIRYGFELDDINCKQLISTDDCLCKLFAWLYFQKKGGAELILLYQEALRLSSNSFDRNWIFCYEVLDASDLKDDWKTMKKSGVSFIK